MDYLPRVVDEELAELIAGLPAISIEGPKSVGKTETARRYAATVHRLDDPTVLEIAQGSLDRLTEGRRPILIDEWQRLPATWDLVRRSVDDDRGSRFILTGSSAPAGVPLHSGAGRIVSVRMRPMALAERGLGEPTVRLGDLLAGGRPDLRGVTEASLADYAQEIVRSGFPGIRRSDGRLLRAELDAYIDRVVSTEFEEAGHVVRDQAQLRRWLAAYAAATSTPASYTTIRDAAYPGDADKPARSTTIPYRRTLERLWVIEEVPAWSPSRNRLRRLARSPVHQLADPALAARLLGVDVGGLIEGSATDPVVPRDGSLLGALFQSLVTLSVRVYAQQNETRVGHLRTHQGDREIDLIVERGDGRVIALEVKLSETVSDSDVRHLHWLADNLGDDLLDAAVITTGPQAYRRLDGIGVIPAALLGP